MGVKGVGLHASSAISSSRVLTLSPPRLSVKALILALLSSSVSGPADPRRARRSFVASSIILAYASASSVDPRLPLPSSRDPRRPFSIDLPRAAVPSSREFRLPLTGSSPLSWEPRRPRSIDRERVVDAFSSSALRRRSVLRARRAVSAVSLSPASIDFRFTKTLSASGLIL